MTENSTRTIYSYDLFNQIIADLNQMLELLKWQGYERASLAVQKANYAVKMYEKVGFKIVNENDEEYIMVCEL